MFFNIGKHRLSNFPYYYQHNNLIINLDSGWISTNDVHGNRIFYKGYLDNSNISDCIEQIAEQEEPQLSGNFCLIKCFDKGVTIKTDRFRSIPLWYNKDIGITNLENIGTQIHTDSFVMLTNDLEKIESKFDIIGEIDNSKLSLLEVVNKIDNLLTEKFLHFFSTNTLPVHVFLSGGIDTMTLYSYILKFNISHKLINYYHTDLDYFYLKNHGTLQNFWGFKQIHYWNYPCVLLSGAPGDEFTVRSPTTANMLLRYYNTGIDELLVQKHDTLHAKYFSKYNDIFSSQKNLQFKTFEEAVGNCLNLILNDYQHWHLGHTICYTPFRDINLFKTIARLGQADLERQIFSSVVQIELIRRNAPHLFDGLSTHKNTDNHMENLVNLYTEQLPDRSL